MKYTRDFRSLQSFLLLFKNNICLGSTFVPVAFQRAVSNTFCIPLQLYQKFDLLCVAFVLLVCVHRTVIERLPPGDIGTSVLLPSRGFFETKTKAEAASNSPASDLAPTSTSGSARAALLFCSFCYASSTVVATATTPQPGQNTCGAGVLKRHYNYYYSSSKENCDTKLLPQTPQQLTTPNCSYATNSIHWYLEPLN